MLSFDGKYILCDCGAPDCTEKIENHSWSKIRSDWFMMKGGKAFHPDHKPEWVNEWQRRQS